MKPFHTLLLLLTLLPSCTIKPTQTLTAHTATVNALSFHPNGKQLASGSSDQTIRIWNTADWSQHHMFKTGVIIQNLAYARAGAELSATDIENTAFAYDTIHYKKLRETPVPFKTSTRLTFAFSPDGAVVAAAVGDAISLQDSQTSKQQHRLIGHADDITGLCFRADGNVLASGSLDRSVRLWDPHTGRELKRIQEVRDVHAIALSERVLATAGLDKNIKLFRADTGELFKTISDQAKYVTALAFSPDGKLLLSGGSDRNILIWDVAEMLDD